jgi:hypothetical protein
MAEATFTNEKGQEGKVRIDGDKMILTAPLPDGFDVEAFKQKVAADGFCSGCKGVSSGFVNFMG